MNIIKLTNNIFKIIETSEDVNKLEESLDIEQSNALGKMQKRYPRLKFRISREEIQDLVTKGLIDAEGNANALLIDQENAPTKLLYSLAWKQGDVIKLKHIIKGIKGDEFEADGKGLVFYYFGKHLADPKKEPIIDQHVIRSWKLYNGKQSIMELQKLNSVSVKDLEDINEYKKWFMKNIQPKGIDFIYLADRILFLLGRKIKKSDEE